MKIKSFFERSYLITLILFLFLLNGGIFSVAAYSYHTGTEAAKRVCRAEQFCINEAFSSDYENRKYSDENLLFVTYGSFYSQKQIRLRFTENGEVRYSDIPAEYASPSSGVLSVKRIDGKRILLISEEACDGKFLITYCKDVSYLDEDLKQMMSLFVLLSVAFSVLLALLLYFVQRKLYLPLKNLRSVTKEISSGKLDARADDSGADEFSELAKDFNAMADTVNAQMERLKHETEQKQLMLDNIAHEMRTPLTSIHGYAEYVFGVPLSEEERMRAMQAIMNESMRLKNISAALLESAFLRENKIEPHPVSLGSVLEKVAKRLSSFENGAQTVRFLGGDATVEGDATLLEELFSNLTENALHACKENGLVELGLETEKDGITAFVRDNGKGMTEEQLAHITEPFYRTDRARDRKNGGTGLGLALCKRIADVHDAKLCFVSEPNNGTTAFVIFKKIR